MFGAVVRVCRSRSLPSRWRCLLSALSKLEHAVLELLNDGNVPVGSGTLWCALYGKDCSMSEPTLGRLLRQMDTLGLTVKVGKRGRILTPVGRARLEELRGQKERAGYEGEFLNAIRIDTLEDVMDVLVARRAIERETARMAAIHAKPEDVEEIRRALETQKEHVERGEYAVEEDRLFHRVVAQAAGNRVLSSALDLIRHDPQLAAVVIAVRQYSGSRMAIEHGQLLEAIQERDPVKAEQAMLKHLDRMIAEVEGYRQQQAAQATTASTT